VEPHPYYPTGFYKKLKKDVEEEEYKMRPPILDISNESHVTYSLDIY
jgi:hypothetical protein